VTPGEHLGWRISALLDDELNAVEEDLALDHLAACEHCQSELAEITAARDLVRSLGEVEPPQGYLDRLIDSRRFSPRLGLVGLVTLAAAWVLILAIGVGITLPDVSPPVDQFAVQHDTLEDLVAEPDRLPTRTDGFERVTSEQLAARHERYQAPESLDSVYDRVGVYDDGEVVQVLYSDGAVGVSLFEQQGSLDWAALPDGGEEVDVDGTRAWTRTTPGTDGGPAETVLVVPKGAVVYTLVSEGSREELIALAESLPDTEPFSLSERAGRNFRELARRFGLGTSTGAELPDRGAAPADRRAPETGSGD
jgi:hypothetical protein